jgi:Na+-translocating ferredoxin:NAD+ oxidoreductase RnfE subunit
MPPFPLGRAEAFAYKNGLMASCADGLGLGIYLPLITTNCAVLGVCLININEDYNFIKTLVSSFGYSTGFGFALVLFAGVRERILLARVPKPLQDTSSSPQGSCPCFFSPLKAWCKQSA